jgi:energy-coupling factor transporter ATP-binding protein EcfA2
MQISEIVMNNYRAFFNEKGKETEKYKIDFQGKKNLLIYGENGSGKSSLFRGIKDLFVSSAKSELEFIQNVFSKDIELDSQPFVQVTFSHEDASTPYVFSKDPSVTNTEEEILRAVAKTKSFMTYRDLLRVHFEENSEMNLFNFLFVGFDSLLGEIDNPVSSQAETNIKMNALWENVQSGSDEINRKDFTNGANQILQDLSQSLNCLLQYFDDSLEIYFEPLTLKMIEENKAVLKLNVKYFGKDLNLESEQYHHFLNEARLSSLAVCIFLSAHLSVPKGEYEILFLDDIFTGLDTSNRMPLLDILTADVIRGTPSDTFKNHQIILTTYDRNWYELARKYLGEDNWTYKEIFIDKNSEGFDQPAILPGQDDLKRAEYYFKMKQYPACANYQRKICERIIKDFLPDNLKYKKESNGDIKLRDQLGELTDMLFKYMGEVGIDTTPIKNFPICMRVVLNPFSHDDIDSQIYRRELEVTFEIIEILKTLKSDVIISEGTKVSIEKTHKETGILYKYEFEVATSVKSINFHGNTYTTDVILLPLVLDIADIPRLMSQSGKVEVLYNKICHFLKADKNADFFSEFTLLDGTKLSEKIN